MIRGKNVAEAVVNMMVLELSTTLDMTDVATIKVLNEVDLLSDNKLNIDEMELAFTMYHDFELSMAMEETEYDDEMVSVIEELISMEYYSKFIFVE